MREYSENWFELPAKFGELANSDDGREFLEAIPGFMSAKQRGLLADIGYEMPNIGSLIIGRVHGIEFVNDEKNPSDSKIVVVRREYFTDI